MESSHHSLHQELNSAALNVFI